MNPLAGLGRVLGIDGTYLVGGEVAEPNSCGRDVEWNNRFRSHRLTAEFVAVFSYIALAAQDDRMGKSGTAAGKSRTQLRLHTDPRLSPYRIEHQHQRFPATRGP